MTVEALRTDDKLSAYLEYNLTEILNTCNTNKILKSNHLLFYYCKSSCWKIDPNLIVFAKRC